MLVIFQGVGTMKNEIPCNILECQSCMAARGVLEISYEKLFHVYIDKLLARPANVLIFMIVGLTSNNPSYNVHNVHVSHDELLKLEIEIQSLKGSKKHEDYHLVNAFDYVPLKNLDGQLYIQGTATI